MKTSARTMAFMLPSITVTTFVRHNCVVIAAAHKARPRKKLTSELYDQFVLNGNEKTNFPSH